MVSTTILWATILLECAILFRGFRGRVLSKYLLFYIYIFCVLGASVPGYFLYSLYASDSPLYRDWYWGAQLTTLVVAYGILLEIFKHVLSPYPGAERFARVVGLFVLGVIFCFALVYPLLMSQHSSPGTIVEFERDLRTVQAIFLFAVMAVVSYYGIAIGRNMRGMIFGYGLYIGTSLVSLAVRSYAGTGFDEAWKIIQPSSYLISLVVWLAALWSYHPNPVAESPVGLEADYEAFAARIRRMMGTMRAYFIGTVRS
jgi:hypothetical protein